MIACFKAKDGKLPDIKMLHWGYNGESAWTAKLIYFFMLFHYKDLEGYHVLLLN